MHFQRKLTFVKQAVRISKNNRISHTTFPTNNDRVDNANTNNASNKELNALKPARPLFPATALQKYPSLRLTVLDTKILSNIRQSPKTLTLTLSPAFD